MTSADQLRVEIITHLDHYMAAFNSRDFELTSRCYQLPSTFISADSVTVVNTSQEFIALMNTIMAGLTSTGFERSAWTDRQIILLGDRLALASTTVQRFHVDGSVLGTATNTYTLRKDADGWRVVVTMSQPMGTQLKA
jgi:ketosteroid isomerase-like protein